MATFDKKTNMNAHIGTTLHIRNVLIFAALVTLLMLSTFAHADRIVNSVSLNGVPLVGTNSITVAPSAAITALVNITTNNNGGNNNWRSTGWLTYSTTTFDGTSDCENHANHDNNGTYAESFSITAPATPGTYNVYFAAYSDNVCNNDASAVFTRIGALNVASPLTVTSINRLNTDPTNIASTVSWSVVFSQSVSGVDAADFALAQAGGATGATITSVSGSSTTWTVNASTGSAAGTLGLNLVDNDTIVNVGGAQLGGTGVGNGNFTGQIYTIVAPPSVTSINRASTDPTTPGAAVAWTVIFSKSVTSVNLADFALSLGGSVTGASLTTVTGSGTTWTVNANTGSGDGTLGLNLVDDDSIQDTGSRALGGAGAGNGNFAGQLYTISPPSVTSINLASTDPTNPANAVAWTVVFSRSVTGVDAADFALAQAGGVSGASIASVTGAGTTWTVNANTGSGAGTLGLNLIDNDTIVDAGGSKLGGTGAGNGNFTGQAYTVKLPFCSPPTNAPSGLTCVCDTFGRTALNPSTIFGSNWAVSNSDGISNPSINAVTKLLRLTESTANNAKAATAPGIFPAAGNYISVEFNHYAYNGTGADGIVVTLSDYLVPAVPGGYGGSLGYAPNSNGSKPGFAGGWVGIALDEYGNYQNPTEGRILGPGARADSIGVRGPGSGANGYRWLGGTGSNPGGLGIDNNAATAPTPGYMYQVIVDARSSASNIINVSVNRDATTKDGSSYVSLFGPFNAYTEANYALTQGWITQLVPDYWKISFTGSTGASDNIHEIGSLRICAQTVYPSSGGTASGFSVIDEAYPAASGSTVPAYPNFQTGNIYMKLAGTPFKLWVAALTSTGISSAYSATTNKYTSVKLVDNSDNACGTDAARTCNSACTGKTAVESGGTNIVSYTASNPGAKLSSDFTLNSSWKNLIAVVQECTTSTCTAFTATAPACSTDSFSVRPTGITTVTSSATNAAATGTPVFKAGADNFTLVATSVGVGANPSGYTGVLKINNATVQTVNPVAGVDNTTSGFVSPSTFPAATTGTPSSVATGNFTYSEVGAFVLPGYDPAANTTSPRGVYDGVDLATECSSGPNTPECDILRTATWTGVDSVSTKGDCISGSYANVKNTSGKYGCLFGNIAPTPTLGRFIPHRFGVSATGGSPMIRNRSEMNSGAGCAPDSPFTYMGEPMTVRFTLSALNASGDVTKNYAGSYVKLSTTDWLTSGIGNTIGLWMVATAQPVGAGTCEAVFSAATPSITTFDCSGVGNPAAISRTAGPRVAVASTPAAPSWVNGTSAFSADVRLERADKPDGHYATLHIGIAPRDTDGVTFTVFDLDANNDGANERTSLGTTGARYGRLQIPTGYGSELLSVPVKVQTQYWGGTSYLNNTEDNCTPLIPANLSTTQGAGATITSSLTGGGTADSSGAAIMRLGKPDPAPTSKGTIILKSSTTAPLGWPIGNYLPGTGTQTFGLYKAGPVIYIRELY